MRIRTHCLGFVVVAASLGATETAVAEDAVSVQASVGATRFLGDLAGNDVGFAIDVQVKTLFVRIGESRFSAHLGFNLFLAWTTHAGDQFPFAPQSDIAVRGFLFLPNLCWDPATATRLCAAIGQGTVNVNTDGDRRDYGTWNYELSVRQRVVRDLFVSAAAKYVGRVEQQVGGVDSYFTVTALTVGAGWVW